MTTKVLVLGGSKGLGLSLALEAVKNQMIPYIIGREVHTIQQNQQLKNAKFICADILESSHLIPVDEHFDYFIWSAGIFLKKSLEMTTDHEIDTMINLHFREPIRLLRDFIKNNEKPFHLIVIASSSSWKLRENESIYTGIKAAQATFVRNLVPELKIKYHDAKVTLINPGGLNTPNFHQSNIDVQDGTFLDPDCVASLIWEKALTQQHVFAEWQILRNKNNPDPKLPIIIEGPLKPEIPSP